MREELFIEVGTEEIPARLLDGAREALIAGVAKLLGSIEHGNLRGFSSPRRIAVAVDVALTRPSVERRITGPSAAIAFKDGQLTPAGEAFARKNGVPASMVSQMDTPKGPVAVITRLEGGEATAEVVAAGLEATILGIPFKKSMRWGAGAVRFARPIQYVCARVGGRTINATVAGLFTTGHSRGHYLLSPEPFEFQSSLHWLTELRQRFVLADPGERRGEMLLQLRRAAEDLGAEPEFDAELVDEVLNLVEWPKVIVGSFDPVLLELPSRLLVEAMKKHQRYFPIYQNGQLSNQFLVVTNNPFGDGKLIAEGNARVLAARFHDARFFYGEDRRKSLDQHGEKLQEMTWIRGMGSMADRQTMLAAASRRLAERVGADEEVVARAALLCKSDLTTQMVGEFPELQGHVGKLLAQLQGESFEVATAIEEHYLPRSAGDYLPQSPAGRALALAERLSLLSWCFEKGIKPTASTDAQGLRRAAVGALQILLEADVRGDVRRLLHQVRPDRSDVPDDAIRAIHQEVAEFLQGRLKALLVAEGHATDLVEAVIATSGMDLVHDAERVRALGALAKAGSFEPIRTTFRRAGGLVKEHPSSDYDVASLSAAVERDLHHALQQLPEGLTVAAMLEALTGLRPVVDRFFEGVLVMSEDANERRNRLGLLKAVTLKFSSLADFTRLSSE